MIYLVRNRARVGYFTFTCILILLIALTSSTISPALATPQHETSSPISANSPTDPGELGSFLDGVIKDQMAQRHIPGATLSVIKNGLLFYSKGYGSCNLQAGIPVDPQTSLFQAGSVGKVITTAAVLQLIDQGKLDLKADVNTYLKSFQIPNNFPEPITLANLLTHTAGFEDHITGKDASSISDLQPLGEYLADHIPTRVRPPGRLTAYSNYGFALAGYIVEQVSGMPYDQYLDQYIFQPLGMSSSTFRQPIPGNLSSELCPSYNYTGASYSPNPFELLQDYPAGSLTTTADDMAKLMAAFFQGGKLAAQQILSPDAARSMLTQQFTNDPHLPGMAFGFEQLKINGQFVFIKEGDISAFHSILALLPDQKMGFFISYNSDGGAGAGRAVLLAFFDHCFTAVNQTGSSTSLEGFDQRASQIIGTYSPTRRGYTTYEKILSVVKEVTVTKAGNGSLHIASLGSSPWTLIETSPWVFNRIDGPQVFVFRTGPEGMQMALDTEPIQAFIKLPWYEAPIIHLILIIISVMIFLSALILWPFKAMQRKLKQKKPGKPSINNGAQYPHPLTLFTQVDTNPLKWQTLPRSIQILSVGVSILNLLFIILLIYFLASLGSYPVIMRGVTPLLTLLFLLALISVVLTFGMIVGSILAWMRCYWTPCSRVYYAIITLAAIMFVFELLYWNLLGFRV